MTEPGLLFRNLEDYSDLHGMYQVSKACFIEEGLDIAEDFENFCEGYAAFTEILPAKDVLVVELDGKIIGHARVWWKDYFDGTRLYSHSSTLLPEFSQENERISIIEWAEARLAKIAMNHPPEIMKAFETQCLKGYELENLLVSIGYTPKRINFEMVRSVDEMVDESLVSGIAIRPVREDEIKDAWTVTRDSFRGQETFAEVNWSDERFEEKLRSPHFDASLWFVAIDGGKVVGSIQNFINTEHNRILNSRRGHITNLCVSDGYRRQGIARALIMKSLEEFRKRELHEARVDVDSENPSGALTLYRSLEFTVSGSYLSCQKLFV